MATEPDLIDVLEEARKWASNAHSWVKIDQAIMIERARRARLAAMEPDELERAIRDVLAYNETMACSGCSLTIESNGVVIHEKKCYILGLRKALIASRERRAARRPADIKAWFIYLVAMAEEADQWKDAEVIRNTYRAFSRDFGALYADDEPKGEAEHEPSNT